MEPRPPRPRGAYLGQVPTTGTPIDPSTANVPYQQAVRQGQPVAVPLAGEPLLPRQQRAKQRIWRVVLSFVVGLALLAGAAYLLKDFLFPAQTSQTAQMPAATVIAATSIPVNGPTPPAGGDNLLATAVPTATFTPAATTPPEPTPTTNAPEQPAADPATMSMIDLLPTDAMMPAGLLETATGERSLGDVVGALGGTPEVETYLRDWGWEGNAFRDFFTEQGTTTPNGTYVVNVSVHRFMDDESADNALIFFSDYFLSLNAMEEVTGDIVGDGSRLFIGAPEGEPQAVMYVRKGNVMYRIGSNATVDSVGTPAVDVTAVAQAIAAR